MKKLTTAQWIAFLFIAGGIVVGQLDQYGVSVKYIGVASSTLGSLKLLWDAFNSFQAQDVADFSNDNPITQQAKGGALPNTKQDVTNWVSNK